MVFESRAGQQAGKATVIEQSIRNHLYGTAYNHYSHVHIHEVLMALNVISPRPVRSGFGGSRKLNLFRQ